MVRKSCIYVYMDGERCAKHIRSKKHGFSSVGRSRYALKLQCRKESMDEYLMSHREMRKYWEEPTAPLYGPLQCWTRWLRSKHYYTVRTRCYVS